MTTIKERPILFSTPMVQAILAGNKTQTRRTKGLEEVNKNPDGHSIVPSVDHPGLFYVENGFIPFYLKCPYGQPGDRLWVRESWQAWTEFNGTAPNDLPEDARLRINYLANGNTWDARLRPSIHMPRWACRLVLEITNIRVERLQDISEADAIAEGIEDLKLYPNTKGGDWKCYTGENSSGWWVDPRHSFYTLWKSINGPASWAANPWVWVVDFRKVEGGANG